MDELPGGLGARSGRTFRRLSGLILRVMMAGTFDPEFARNHKLHRLLEIQHHEVTTCQIDLWGSERVEIPTTRKLTMLARASIAYPRLIWRFLRAGHADVVLICHPGWFDMLVLAPIARLRGMRVVFDMFISLYDTVVSDRKLIPPGSPLARVIRRVDRRSLRLADRVIADTPADADFFAEMGGVPRNRIGVVWLGARDDIFQPQPAVEPVANRVLFHGTFIGLQGLDTILRAAKLLESDGVEVRMIGTGQEQETVDRLIGELQPSNVHLVGLVPLDRVPEEIAAAALCLGIFGTSGKARRVIPNKLYECLAVGRPVLTGDTPATRSAFGEAEIAVSPPGDARSLAREIRHLLADETERESIARIGHERYRADYSEVPLSELLEQEIQAA